MPAHKGKKHAKAYLSDEQVEAIHYLYEEALWKIADIARQFTIPYQTACSLCYREHRSETSN